jgi:hypothetical protein
MSSSNPFQPLIEIVGTILRKNYSIRGKTFSIYIHELPFLPQNLLGANELTSFVENLIHKGIKMKIVRKSGGFYEMKKLTPEVEQQLISEKKNLEAKDASGEKEIIILSNQAISFNDEKAELKVGVSICAMPPFQNEHFFCRSMFKYNVDEPVDWSAVYQEMTGSPETIGDNKNKRTVQDTMYAINNRIKADLNTEDNLFTWKNKSIKRNF